MVRELLSVQIYNFLANSIKLQIRDDVSENFISRLGQLHCIFAIIKIKGKYIEKNGLDQLFLESDMFSPVTTPFTYLH